MSSFDSLKVDELRNIFQGKSKSKKSKTSTKSTKPKPKKRSRKTKAEKIVESPYFDELDQSLNQSDDDLPQTKKPKHKTKSVSLKSSKKKSSSKPSKKSKVVQLGAPEDSRTGLNSQSSMAAPIQHDLVNLTRNVASFFGPNSLFLGQQHSIGPIDNGLLDKFEKQQ
jgi:hypothetical protein